MLVLKLDSKKLLGYNGHRFIDNIRLGKSSCKIR